MEIPFIQVFISCATRSQAQSMVDSMLEAQIIACAQIMPKIESFYRWHGQTERAEEYLLIVKSKKDHFIAIEATVKRLHSYEVPEILAVPVVDGSTDYLNWINEQLKS
ncbi:divalent-cation tolerance protein CutA [Marinicella litoralis]|uniref:Uncharacterized protein involved in tolerance to divalent cations n=2 Tax=Marinicella litoralis TaxID=644220 RepID=A0A4R6XYK3_9GAMM|nr:uncharacterized protein involved in tolerance to divalent cations [Marinicella litoralis]